MYDRQGDSYGDYNIQLALADAVRYHAACSTIVGLNEAGASIIQAQDPGLSRLNTVLQNAGVQDRFAIGEDGEVTIRAGAVAIDDLVFPGAALRAGKHEIQSVNQSVTDPLLAAITAISSHSVAECSALAVPLADVTANITAAVTSANTNINDDILDKSATALETKLQDRFTTFQTAVAGDDEAVLAGARVGLLAVAGEASAFKTQVDEIPANLNRAVDEAASAARTIDREQATSQNCLNF